MKRVYKITALLLVLCAVLSCAACGSDIASTVSSPDDVRDKKIGAVKGTLAAAYASSLGEAHLYETAELMVGELKLGITDCALHDEYGVNKVARGGVETLDDLYCERELCIITARENADLMKEINGAISYLEEEKIISKIIESYKKGKGPYYQQREDIDRSKATITLAVRTDIAPYCYVDVQGELAGIDIDVAKAIADYMAVEIIIEPVEPGKLIKNVWYGKNHMAMGNLAYNEVDGENVLFSDHYAEYKQAIIVRK